MKLQQLRYICEVAKRGMNVSAAAQTLHTSQPGISRQILQLEEELGLALFVRNGKHLTGLTPAGERIVALATDVLRRVENIRVVAREFAAEDRGTMGLATTHTQSRYVLPPVIRRFIQKYPNVALHMHQGTPLQIAELAAKGTADLAIATEAMEHFRDLVMLPCYRWNRVILLPKGHELASVSRVQLADLARFPLVTYVFGFTGRSRLDDAFRVEGLTPHVVFTAADADVIKTYVRLGIGIGIVASMAYDPAKDDDLVALDASHLFAYSVTKVGFQRGALLRGFLVDFIAMLAPHLDRSVIEQAQQASNQGEVDALFADVEIPVY